MKTKKGFTLIELVVAIGILAMMLGFTSVIFQVSIKGSRAVGANAEIMQKLRAITNQLDRDLRGLDKDAPLLIWFERGSANIKDLNRFDQIMFFATGNFQSTQLYSLITKEPVEPDDEKDGDKYISGSAARIYYGQAQGTTNPANVNNVPSKRILCRRRHIFVSDEVIKWPTWDSVGSNLSDFRDSNPISWYLHNDRYEHDSLSLTQWKNVDEEVFNRANTGIVAVVFENRPKVQLDDPNTYHNLLSEEVASFKIQWAYWNPDTDPKENELRWFPSDDPDRDGDFSDSHFNINANKKFGVYFNVADTNINGFRQWYPIGHNDINYNGSSDFDLDFYPKALKFTFTINDSKGVIEGGRIFTHIVYIGE